MAGEARKLAQKLQVPPTYTKGVGARGKWVKGEDGKMRKTVSRGASVAGVMNSADDILVRMEGALDTWRKAKDKGEGVNAAIKPLDEMAELVRRAEIESKDDGGAVVANVASALMRLNPDDRMTVLRRAGRPEMFEPLLDAELAEPDAGGLDRVEQSQSDRKAIAKSRIAQEKSDTFSADKLPLSQRPSSFFVTPDRTSKKGNPVKSSQTYKEHLPKEGNSPLDVQAKRGGEKKIARGGSGGLTQEDIEVFGMTEAEPSTRKRATNALADDQIAQVKAIEKKGMPATLPGVIRSKKKDSRISEADGPNTLTVGASQRPGAEWSGRPGMLEIEDEVARRNRSEMEKVIGALYEKTAPTATEAAGVGKGARLRAVAPTDTTIDLDQMFPWWRGRFAQLDARGRYQYPSRLPSAEWMAGMIQGMGGVADPDFVTRVAPLLQRSIDFADATPTTPQAAHYNSKVFLLSPQMEKAMRQGVGSRDYPAAVYGERKIPRERVVKPARTFKEQFGSEATAAPKSQGDARSRVKALMNEGEPPPAAPQKTLDKIQQSRERVKKLMQDRPGTGETSSIYTVPQNSPVQYLLA